MKRLAAALLLLAGCALAEAPPVVAVRNARIVTVSGPVIAKGTVVIRNGLIDAVGENVAVPPEALLIEGEGLTVYPGLIDALSTVGMPGAAAADRHRPLPPRRQHRRRARMVRRIGPRPRAGCWPPMSCSPPIAASKPCAAPVLPPPSASRRAAFLRDREPPST
jgi:hypothetical protein